MRVIAKPVWQNRKIERKETIETNSRVPNAFFLLLKINNVNGTSLKKVKRLYSYSG